jgi:hypothetical protein
MNVITSAHRGTMAKEAYWLLNSFIGDFIAAERALGIIQSPGARQYIDGATSFALTRILLSSLVLSLARLAEFYEHYRAIIPESQSKEFKKLYKDIQARKIKYFRNSYIGHIWDKKKNAPLDSSEIDSALNSIFSTGPGDFFRWINEPETNNIGNTVAGIVERTRDELQRQYGIANVIS